MAPTPALATYELTQDIMNSRLQGEKAPRDVDAARIALCSERTIRYHRSNMLLYGSTKAPTNGAGCPKTITPLILVSLCNQLTIDPCMPFKEMAAFLRAEFDADVTRFSISRALNDVGWSRKVTQNVDLRDEYMYKLVVS
jgi:hypothetical protein